MTNTAELLRLLNNLIRLGTIAEVDHGAPGSRPPRCRVKSGDIITAWLPWFSVRAGQTRDWNPPTQGEQCLLFSPGGDLSAGVALVGINSAANPAPSNDPNVIGRWYPDGAAIEYDHVAHHLRAILPGSAEITAPGGARLNADTTINGSLSINGGSVTHNGTNIGDDHQHTGVDSGPSNTGGPV